MSFSQTHIFLILFSTLLYIPDLFSLYHNLILSSQYICLIAYHLSECKFCDERNLAIEFLILAHCLVHYKLLLIICQNAFTDEARGRSHISGSLVCHVVEMELYPKGRRSHQEMVSRRLAYALKEISQRKNYLVST